MSHPTHSPTPPPDTRPPSTLRIPYRTRAPRETRTRRGIRIAALVGAIVVAFCCAGSVILPRIAQRISVAAEDMVEPAQSAAIMYFDALQAADYPTAYALLCREVRNQVSLESFTRARSTQRITRYQVLGAEIHNWNGKVGGTVTVRVYDAERMSSTQLLPLRKEDGAWRICG